MSYIQYPNKGICRKCESKAESPQSTLCIQCHRVVDKERMRLVWRSNISQGLTAHGNPRKRAHRYVNPNW